MLHASVRAVGPVAGTPNEIHLALKDVLTDEGTLLMYAGCPQYFDEIGRGNLTKDEEAELFEILSAFDPLTAPAARDNGALVEFFRTYPGTKVSNHVTRFAAWGKHTDHLLSHQPWDFTYGQGSVFERFLELDGRILLLGSDHDNVTFLHYVEHVVDIQGKIVTTFMVPALEHGTRVWRQMKEYDTFGRAHPAWPDRFFAQIVDFHLDATNNRGKSVGRARSFLLDARSLARDAEAIMTRTANVLNFNSHG
jgi:aminoglycoside 3-N-acetyltransferase